jgi:hypothetical protein
MINPRNMARLRDHVKLCLRYDAGRLPVTQPFAKGQDQNHGQHTGRQCRLTLRRKEMRKGFVLEEHAQPVAQRKIAPASALFPAEDTLSQLGSTSGTAVE